MRSCGVCIKPYRMRDTVQLWWETCIEEFAWEN
jgi:hypothetical protein